MNGAFFATFLKGMRGRVFLGEERKFEEEEEEGDGREEMRIEENRTREKDRDEIDRKGT